MVGPSSVIGSSTVNFLLTRDSNSNEKKEAVLTVNTVDCSPSGFTITPDSVTVKYQGEDFNLEWQTDAKNSICGSYSVQINPQ
jgi:hypothetical protein